MLFYGSNCVIFSLRYSASGELFTESNRKFITILKVNPCKGKKLVECGFEIWTSLRIMLVYQFAWIIRGMQSMGLACALNENWQKETTIAYVFAECGYFMLENKSLFTSNGLLQRCVYRFASSVQTWTILFDSIASNLEHRNVDCCLYTTSIHLETNIYSFSFLIFLHH